MEPSSSFRGGGGSSSAGLSGAGSSVAVRADGAAARSSGTSAVTASGVRREADWERVGGDLRGRDDDGGRVIKMGSLSIKKPRR